MFFRHFIQRATTFVISCLLPLTTKPFQMGSTFQGKKIVPLGANSFFEKLTPTEKGGKKRKNGGVASPECITVLPSSQRPDVVLQNCPG